MNETIQQIQAQRLQSLADNPANLVYKFAYDVPEKKASASQVMTLARDLFLQRQAKTMLTDEEARAELKANDESFAALSRTHPRIFYFMTDKIGGPKHFEVLFELGALRKQVETGCDEAQANAMASSLILERAKAEK
jgi:hypothetical protein